jgi:hypothetical protein
MIGKARLRERIGCVSQKVAAAIGYDLQSMARQRIGYVSQSGQQESIGCDRPTHCRSKLAMIRKARVRERTGCVSQKVAAAIGYDLQSLPRQRIGYLSQSGQQESIGYDRQTHCRSRLVMIRKAGAQAPNWLDP